ncbi:Abi-alpha family protein [Conexibacter sp. DBS9H8]|uniref:Abi-alpha family protein n=1 Tax=Conexibacter sp. DBS9H8 TaxID=2937801 RepID=UPI00200F655B|nr:Abi-alpha family protein [Conexibacter sp. DBS9H8]
MTAVTRADEIIAAFEDPVPGAALPGVPEPSAGSPAPPPPHSAPASSAPPEAQPAATETRRERTGTTEGAQPAPSVEPASEAEPTARAEDAGDGSGAAHATVSSASPYPTGAHDGLPQLARTAAGAWLKAAGWTAGTSLRVSGGLRRLALDPNGAQEVIEEVTRELREVARDFLGVTELAEEVHEMAPLLSTGLLKAGTSSPEALRAQGEQLLREAADVGFDEGAHPAFARILTELSPDEARILRLLFLEGPQPLVDVRATNLIGSGSQLIARSLNMLGPKAGLRQHDRVPVYLANLQRVNLIELSRDPLDSLVDYQVLEAQPATLAVLHNTVRARVDRHSIHLTPLGTEFCRVCLPVGRPALPPPSSRV